MRSFRILKKIITAPQHTKEFSTALTRSPVKPIKAFTGVHFAHRQPQPDFYGRPYMLSSVDTPDKAAALLRKGLSIHPSKPGRSTPLHYTKNAKVAKFLIDAGADVNAKDWEGLTPLHKALGYDAWDHQDQNTDPELVALLLAKGANPNIADKTGAVPLSDAVDFYRVDFIGFPVDSTQTRNPKIVELLLAHGADITSKGPWGKPILHMAVKGETDGMGLRMFEKIPQHQENILKTVELLLAKKADPNSQDEFGRTALHYIHYPKVAELLLRGGANPNIKDFKGQTPLHTAHDPDVVSVLLKYGADVHAVDSDGASVLTYAYNQIKDTHVLEMLLDAKADPNIADKYSQTTPLHLARNTGSVEALLSHGANPRALDKQGKTPLDYAKDQHIKELLQAALAEDKPEFRMNYFK